MDSKEVVARVARTLQDSNKEHKRAIRYHRKALKEGMEALRKICEEHGIKLSIKGGGKQHGPEDAAGTHH